MDSNEDQQRDQFFKNIQPHLESFNQFVREEVEYNLATGDLKSDELTTEDVVDAVVLNAFEEYKKSPPKFPLDRWLVMLAMKYVRNEIRRLRQDREEFVHLEENIPETPPEEEVVTLGEETLDFYQPDEDLRMEDVVADPIAETPEQVAETREAIQQFVNQTLTELPRAWRDAFVLTRVQGFSTAEIAEIFAQPEKKVKQNLQQAENALKKKLIDSRSNTPK
jgi:RNA polymerase sigma factor (sigma-70 family)